LAEDDAGRIKFDALQRTNLLREVAWHEAHQGDLAGAALLRLPEQGKA
jgi:hypothetical protein